MERTALRGRLTWIVAEVADLIEETAETKSVVLRCPDWPGHEPGQHIDVRLTAEDGYQAQRSYSIATPPDGDRVTITVELIQNGEVSPYLVDELAVGDQIEVRGPIGGYFVWKPQVGGPLQLIAGGSGIVPLMAMARSLSRSDVRVPTRLLVSARSFETLIYQKELERLDAQLEALEVTITLTRTQPGDWTGYSRRIDREMLADRAFPSADDPLVFVCGPTGMVETVAAHLLDLGHSPKRIKTERFGPTGG